MRRGEIYVVDLGPGIGREPSGACPVVVAYSDLHNAPYPVVVVVVIGVDTAAHAPTAGITVAATDSGAPADLLFLPSQVRTLDPVRFTAGPIGTVPAAYLDPLLARLKAYLDIP